ncbi:hypothetical protein RND81_14G089400 [Saponaria officinalis]|uniref:Uncharacterized protein n=1 Tax=Saponaria officinalis TaxID=3572 RepID=A0AAW1GRV6_SAPOF
MASSNMFSRVSLVVLVIFSLFACHECTRVNKELSMTPVTSESSCRPAFTEHNVQCGVCVRHGVLIGCNWKTVADCEKQCLHH